MPCALAAGVAAACLGQHMCLLECNTSECVCNTWTCCVYFPVWRQTHMKCMQEQSHQNSAIFSVGWCAYRCRLAYWTYGGPPAQDPFGGADAAERAACLYFMRLTAAEVLDWLDKQHVASANECKRRAALQLVLDAAGELHSADDLLGIAAYRHLKVGSCGATATVQRLSARGGRLYQVSLTVRASIAAGMEAEKFCLTDGMRLHFPHQCNTGNRRIIMHFSSVEAAVQARDEALFVIYGLCAPFLGLPSARLPRHHVGCYAAVRGQHCCCYARP